MPGVATRACSLMTNEFHAASSGRGRAVTITVSSTSQTMPKRASGSATNTSASATGESPVHIRTVCRPGARSISMWASTTPPRSERTEREVPSTSIVTGAYGTCTLVKDRHPRTPCVCTASARFCVLAFGFGRYRMRPSTRIQPSPP